MNICWYCGVERETWGDNIYFDGHTIPFHPSCFEECAEMKLQKVDRNYACCCGCGTFFTKSIEERYSIVGDHFFFREHFVDIVGSDLLEQMIQETYSGNQ